MIEKVQSALLPNYRQTPITAAESLWLSIFLSQSGRTSVLLLMFVVEISQSFI
jgi:hypothetical protein